MGLSDQTGECSFSPSSSLCVFFRSCPVMGNLYGAGGQFKLEQPCGFEKLADRKKKKGNNASALNESQREEI